MKTTSAKDLYKEFYVMRGDASENRIKEFKNMCFADRLSCHRFTANFFRLFLSALTYEFYFKIKCLIKQSSYDEAKKWQFVLSHSKLTTFPTKSDHTNITNFQITFSYDNFFH
jgi:hypothetical protein